MTELRLTRAQLAELRRRPLRGRNKILDAITIKGITHTQLADALGGMSKSQLSELVNGHYKDIQLEATARRIASLFGVCIEDIFPPACAAGRKKAA